MLLKEIPEKDYEILGKVFTSKLGEDALEVLNRHFYNTISFTPGDTHVSAFKEGQRDIVQVLRNSAKHIKNKETE